MELENQLKKTIVSCNLLKKRERIMIGVSGGPDSVCLLYLICALRQEYKLDICCLHFNHLLRPEADREEKFVKALCRKLKVRCITERKDTERFFNGDSLEQTARNLRFDFFLRASRELKIKKIALAHNKDDAVETVLMRMIRGTALKGLRGILPSSRMRGLTIIRPLLEVRKKDILAWLKKRDLDYMVDKSNFKEVFFRNKIRLGLLPRLEEFNPNVVSALFNLGRISALDYQCIEKMSKNEYDKIKKQKGRCLIKLDLAQLKKLDQAMLLNVLRLAVADVKGNTRKLDFRHVEEIRDLIRSRPGQSIVDLPDLQVSTGDSWLVIKALLF